MDRQNAGGGKSFNEKYPETLNNPMRYAIIGKIKRVEKLAKRGRKNV